MSSSDCSENKTYDFDATKMEQKMYMNYIHPSSLLRQLADLWRTDQLCDAVITVDKTIVAKAHKLVLFAVSPKLKSDSRNSAQSAFLDVCLPSGLSHKSVNAFLQYLYEGFLLLTQDLVKDMIRIAEFLEINCLLNCCNDFHKQCTYSDKESIPSEFNHVRWMAMTDGASKRISDDTSGRLSPSLQQKRRKILSSRSDDNETHSAEPAKVARTIEHETVDLTDSSEETAQSFTFSQRSPQHSNQNLGIATPSHLNEAYPDTSTPKNVNWGSQQSKFQQDEPLPGTISIKVENSQTGERVESIQANIEPPPDTGGQQRKLYSERDGQYTATEGSSNMYTQDSVRVKLEPSDDYSVSCESDSNTGQAEMFQGDWFAGDSSGAAAGTSDGQLSFEATSMQMDQFLQQGVAQKGPPGSWQSSQFSRNQSNDGNMSIEMSSSGTSQEEPAEVPAEEPTKEPAEEPTKEPAEEPIEEPAEEPINKGKRGLKRKRGKHELKTKRTSYETSFKLKVIDYAEKNSNRAAQRQFGVNEKQVRDWRKMKDTLKNNRRDKRANRGKKAFWPEVEKKLVIWFEDLKASALPISRKKIRQKAIEISAELGLKNFKGATSWISRFMKRNNLSLVLQRSERGESSESKTEEVKVSVIQNDDSGDDRNDDRVEICEDFCVMDDEDLSDEDWWELYMESEAGSDSSDEID